MNKQYKHKLINRQNLLLVNRGKRGSGEGKIGNKDQLYGDGCQLDLWW